MIKLKNTQEAINGLAKLLIQEPGLIPNLKITRNLLKQNNCLDLKSMSEKYFNSQLEIIRKAQEIANESIWYGFSLIDGLNGGNEGYILYKRVGNRMAPIIKDFERGWDSPIRKRQDLQGEINRIKIDKIITYLPHNDETLFSQRYEIQDFEEDEFVPFKHKHEPLDDLDLKDFKGNPLNIIKFNQYQVLEFEKDLELVI